MQERRKYWDCKRGLGAVESLVLRLLITEALAVMKFIEDVSRDETARLL